MEKFVVLSNKFPNLTGIEICDIIKSHENFKTAEEIIAEITKNSDEKRKSLESICEKLEKIELSFESLSPDSFIFYNFKEFKVNNKLQIICEKEVTVIDRDGYRVKSFEFLVDKEISDEIINVEGFKRVHRDKPFMAINRYREKFEQAFYSFRKQ